MADGDEEAELICKMIGLEEIIITLLLPAQPRGFFVKPYGEGDVGSQGPQGLGNLERSKGLPGGPDGGFLTFLGSCVHPSSSPLSTCWASSLQTQALL